MVEMQVGPQEVEDDALGTNPGFTQPGRIIPSGLEPTVTVRPMI